jgi:hypothetical protein
MVRPIAAEAIITVPSNRNVGQDPARDHFRHRRAPVVVEGPAEVEPRRVADVDEELLGQRLVQSEVRPKRLEVLGVEGAGASKEQGGRITRKDAEQL